MRRFISWTIPIAVVFIIMLAVLVFLEAMNQGPPPDAGAVASRIRDLQTIATTEYRYRDVIYFGEQTRFLGLPAGSRSILFSVSISVLAGVDLNHGVDVEIDDRSSDRVFVTLPAPDIIRVDAEDRSIFQYFVQERFSRIDWVEVSDEVENAKERNKRDAIERGLLLQAERQARAVVTRLLHAGGFSRVQVRFRPPEREITG